MGKKQHSKDRLYITRTEWNTEWGGYKEKKVLKTQLPFYCCALSLAPFSHPYATPDGYVFDLTSILPYLKKNKKHPITGTKLTAKDLIKLKYHKNDADMYYCPVTCKEFNQHSHIVAIRQTGNVYSWNAVNQLNIKENNYKDLLDSTPFSKADIIDIQDPQKPDKHNIESFAHLREAAAEKEKIRATETTQQIFDTIKRNEANEPPKKKLKLSRDPIGEEMSSKAAKTASTKSDAPVLRNPYTSGRMAASFTSTTMDAVYTDERVAYTEQQMKEERWRNVKGNGKKGYIRLVTNVGNLNFQLDCDLVPRTCHNFLLLCEKDYYNNTIFHRNIVSFMIQGGDPTGTGHGGESAWGGKFEDEFHKLLKHDERGILSMANAGEDTNGSQFFITYGAVPHLDGIHSVFGRIVGGMETLNKMETIPTDSKDRPKHEIKILKVEVYTNPFNDPLPHEIAAEKKKKEAEKEKLDSERGMWWSDPTSRNDSMQQSSDVGKYLPKKIKFSNKGGFLGLPPPKNDSKKKKNQSNIFRFKDFSVKSKSQ